MNAKRINDFKDIITSFADCQRKVLPVVNTCLDNITTAATDMDPEKVRTHIHTHTNTCTHIH